MMLRSWWAACSPSAVTDAPLTTSMPGLWMAFWIRVTSVAAETPGADSTSIASVLPGWASSFAAVTGSKPAVVAPSRLSELPKVTMPVIV